ncbi:polypeptide N-acetylgalactosaminyltransferase 1-like isoform X2 [Sitodiplosis mosellana]|uniref:polypeptide N-acetylgalactosaminyltransferase 1-like isoform X2 n=1 Tax=Sitodiplosis mosellana TaxID=263140 RepID=UPI0024453029|nr:polypeptide N-acetylgalactosaminyltransferase 1-like isoform X2 [Sitodiplosis mosellana]
MVREPPNDDSLRMGWSFNISRNYDDHLLCKWTEPIVNPNATNPSDRGEYGKAFVPRKDEEELMEQLKQQHKYNVFASKKISVRRSLPDHRYPECRKIIYPTILPTTSVIIVVHNEILETLLRTIWSIVDRSPPELVKEIILVDDASTWAEYNDLSDHIPELPIPVRFIRNGKREGLIRARLIGAKNAKGSVLTFIDAHMECTEGWLQPILSRIASDRFVVAVPLLDAISSDDMAYKPSATTFINGLRWYLIFEWMEVPERELNRTGHDRTAPVRTPTHVGCAFAIDRQFFFEIGSYDEGMDIWGSENVELAFRTWQCGGSLEVIPCSRVGHLYRISTYSFNGDDKEIVTTRNNRRLIDVWMDEYAAYIYAAYPQWKKVSAGNLTNRLNLKKQLKCKPFRWYLENIYPESLWLREYISIGQIKRASTNKCLDAHPSNYYYSCHGMSGNQLFLFSKNGQILTVEKSCVSLSNDHKSIMLRPCLDKDNLQIWTYEREKQSICLNSFGLCIRSNGDNVTVDESTNADDKRFKWELSSNL